MPHRALAVDCAAVVAGAGSTVALVALDPHHVAAVALIVAGTAAALWLATRPTTAVPQWTLWVVAGGLTALAVARAPLASHDLWSYAAYGRLLEHYHANPYVTAPGRFPADPIVHMVGRGWRDTTSAYGPLFLLAAATITRLAGVHLLAVRLSFQLGAAAAVLGATAIAARAFAPEQRHRAVALVVLQPLVWSSFVNGGHNDVYVGLAAVGAIALLRRERPVSAGVVLALAGLVKLTALLAVPVLVVWLLGRRDARAAWRLLVAVAAPTLVGAVVAPASLTAPEHTTLARISRASPWRAIDVHVLSAPHASTIGIVVTIALVLVIAWRHRAGADVAAPVALALGAYTILGRYFLPWYVAWSLPAAAMTRRRGPAALLTVHGALLFAAYQIGSVHTADDFLLHFLTGDAPYLTIAALVALAWWAPQDTPDRIPRSAARTVPDPVRETAA